MTNLKSSNSNRTAALLTRCNALFFSASQEQRPDNHPGGGLRNRSRRMHVQTKTSSNSPSQSSSQESAQSSAMVTLPGLPIGKHGSSQTGASKTATTKDPAVQRPSTVTYTDSRYGVSFRYPRKYTLATTPRPTRRA